MPLRLLLSDDHGMFRAGLRLLLLGRYPDATLAEAGTGAETIEIAEQLKPDVAVMDIHLPDQDGIEVSRQILARSAKTRIIILSGEPSLAYVSEALKAGVSGYLLKFGHPEELPQAIDTVLQGRLHLCPEANTAALEEYRIALTASALNKPKLSTRELEVLRLTTEGLRGKEIAARLNVGVKTIETYRRRLMKKLGCGSTAELVRYAMREGIIQA